MKVLFLDIDGVCNCATTKQRHRGFIGIDPIMSERVRLICEWTGAKIVLSSTWRKDEKSRVEVRKRVMPFIDVTPSMPLIGGAEMCERGHEIKAWLDMHQNVERYAILDDDSDMLKEQLSSFFQTTWEDGLTEEITNKVIKHLLCKKTECFT